MVDYPPHHGRYYIILRKLYPRILKSLAYNPITLIQEPRQSGKTTVALHLAKELNYTYVSLDDLDILSAAQQDPKGFIAAQQTPLITDEVQRAPNLFLPLRRAVDTNQQAGEFILTGSANPFLMSSVADSLAGRIGSYTLLPFAQAELHSDSSTWIDTIFAPVGTQKESLNISRHMLANYMATRGYPRVQQLDPSDRDDWLASYVAAIVGKDIQEYSTLAGKLNMPNLLQLIATRLGSLSNAAELSRSSGIPATTLHRYLEVLDMFYLLSPLKAWSTNTAKRLVKAPKMYFVDTGIAAMLIERIAPGAFERFFGQLLENFVYSELTKQAGWAQNRTHLYHFRSQSGHEVDFVLENQDGSVVGIEVKSKETIKRSDFSGLEYFKALAGEKFHQGIILHPGSSHTAFAQNLHAMSIAAMWS